MGSQILPLQRFPRSLLTAQPFPQVPNWPTFRAFSVSPFVSAFAMVGQVRAPAAVTDPNYAHLVATIAGQTNVVDAIAAARQEEPTNAAV